MPLSSGEGSGKALLPITLDSSGVPPAKQKKAKQKKKPAKKGK